MTEVTICLIDSEILADVYLAMTGGQRDLGFEIML